MGSFAVIDTEAARNDKVMSYEQSLQNPNLNPVCMDFRDGFCLRFKRETEAAPAYALMCLYFAKSKKIIYCYCIFIIFLL